MNDREADAPRTAHDRARAAIEAEWAERDRLKALHRRLDRFADGSDLHALAGAGGDGAVRAGGD